MDCNKGDCRMISMKRLMTVVLMAWWIIGVTISVMAAPSDPLIASLQNELTESGYDPGPVDGLWGGKTEQALRKYQQDKGLPESGRLDEATATRLGLDLSGLDQSPQDIVDLLAAGKIEVQTEGSGIQSVSLRVRPRTPYPVYVRVPVGTFFVSRNSSSQNMVATEERSLTLTEDDWASLSMPAACANRPRDIPGDRDSFRVQRSPQQAHLARLMPVLDKAGVSYAVRQAAVWIVTDNADYEDLGILISSRGGYGGTRVINETAAANAMRICDEAGIKIKSKAIWRDRKTITAGLADGELKQWIEQK